MQMHCIQEFNIVTRICFQVSYCGKNQFHVQKFSFFTRNSWVLTWKSKYFEQYFWGSKIKFSVFFGQKLIFCCNVHCCLLPCKLVSHDLFFVAFLVGGKKSISLKKFHVISQSVKMSDKQSSKAQLKCVLTCQVGLVYEKWSCCSAQGQFQFNPMLFTISIGRARLPKNGVGQTQ